MYGTALTVSNKAVDIPLATSQAAGVVLVGEGDGLKIDENHLVIDTAWLGNHIDVPTKVSDLANDSGFIDQTTADGRYLKLTGGIVSYVYISNGHVGEAVGGIFNANGVMTLGGESVAVSSDGSFTFNGSQVATQPWAENLYMKKSDKAGLFTQFANYDGAVQITIGGTQKALTIAYANAAGSATNTMGFKRRYVSGSQIADANTMTVDGVEYAMLANYSSTNLWSNMPSGMSSYGNVLQLTSASSSSGQLAWDVNHDSNTPTNRIWWRARNSTGWGNDWQQFVMYRNLGTGAVDTYAGTFAFGGNEALQAGYDYAGLQVGSDNDRWQITAIGSLRWRQNDNNDLTSAWQSWRTILDTSNWSSYVAGFLPLTGGNISGHIYLTGAVTNSSTANTSQIVFGTSSNNHVTITSNTEAIIINPTTGSTIGQSVIGCGTHNTWFLNSVGIGTTSPAYKLDVNGEAKANIIFYGNYNDSGNAGFSGKGSSSSNDVYLWGYTGNKVLIGANGNLVMTFDTNYRVGIGTTNPVYKLDVNGAIAGGNIYAGDYLFMNKGAEGIYLSKDSLSWHNSSHVYTTSLLNFTSAGNVGIGINPQAKLHVNGNVRISGTLTGVTNIDGLMIFDSTNNKVTVGTLEVTTLGMNSISVGDADYKMSITSDDSGVSFSGTNDGYLFDDDIYAVGGHFTGSMTVGSSSSVTNLTVNGRARFGNYVGIGTEPNTSYALDIDGAARAFSFVNGSDIRMKDIVSYMLPSVHDIASAPIIEFKWKKGDGSKNIGSIAQYWEKVFPQAVHEGDGGMLSMEYGNIALASAITAARHSVDNEKKIAELELRVKELESQLNEIKNNNINN